ncbi:hypothetical protein CBM2606_A40164 [Cupriavidus taiwanensis]|nr:hypothetical protein CBM2606_A40164 [Cupriavidus taiwanensis]
MGAGAAMWPTVETSVHTQNIKVKAKFCDPMENPYTDVTSSQ